MSRMANKIETDRFVKAPCDDIRGFFSMWVTIMSPLHGLRPKTSEVFAQFLYERYLLTKEVSDLRMLNKLVLNESEVRVKVRNACGMKKTLQVYNALSEMVEAGVCYRVPKEGFDNRYNYILVDKFVPEITRKDKFNVTFSIEIPKDE